MSAAQESGEPINLTIWLEGEPGTVTAFTEIVDEYMQEHPNVKVELTFFGSDLFNPTLVPALNAGEGPDVSGPSVPVPVSRRRSSRPGTPWT